MKNEKGRTLKAEMGTDEGVGGGEGGKKAKGLKQERLEMVQETGEGGDKTRQERPMDVRKRKGWMDGWMDEGRRMEAS